MPCVETQGIVSIGIGGSAINVPMNIGIASAKQIPMFIGIQEQQVGIPILPLAAHIGGGAVLFTWIAASGQPAGYEIHSATAVDGIYFPYGRTTFRNTIGLINNFPFNRTMYYRIRAFTEDGSFSDWVQVKLGVLQKQSTVMQIRALAGSTMPSGAKIVILDGADRLAGFFASGEIHV